MKTTIVHILKYRQGGTSEITTKGLLQLSWHYMSKIFELCITCMGKQKHN